MIWSTEVKDGLQIHLYGLEIASSYAGMLEGTITTEVTQQVLRAITARAVAGHVSSPVYVVEPTMIADHDPRLPNFVCVGDFTCFETNDPDFDASSLVLVWFQEETPVNGIQLCMPGFDWHAHARDFIY